MTKWILLHQGGQFFDCIANQMGSSAVMISVNDLVHKVEIKVELENREHYWCFNNQIYNLSQCLILHEVFYAVKKALWIYHPIDKKYVESAWQAYILSMFYSQKVLNPIHYGQLSISYYQMKTLLKMADSLKLNTPRISLFTKPSFAAIGYAYLWFQPHGMLGQQMYVETMQKPWLYIPFVFHDKYGMWLGITLPKDIVSKLILLAKNFQLSYGEFYFQKSKEYVFYGVCPKLSEQQYSPDTLRKTADQLRRYYAKV
jgi:hypothetical protein